MKITISKLLPFFIGTLFTLSACSSDDDGDEEINDTTVPVVETVIMPNEGEVYLSGTSFTYDGTFTDDVELMEVEFSLTSLKSASGIDDPVWQPSSFTVELTGTQDEVKGKIFDEDIPAKVYTGDEGYELRVVCTDAAGNRSEATTIKVLIK